MDKLFAFLIDAESMEGFVLGLFFYASIAVLCIVIKFASDLWRLVAHALFKKRITYYAAVDVFVFPCMSFCLFGFLSLAFAYHFYRSNMFFVSVALGLGYAISTYFYLRKTMQKLKMEESKTVT